MGNVLVLVEQVFTLTTPPDNVYLALPTVKHASLQATALSVFLDMNLTKEHVLRLFKVVMETSTAIMDNVSILALKELTENLENVREFVKNLILMN